MLINYTLGSYAVLKPLIRRCQQPLLLQSTADSTQKLLLDVNSKPSPFSGGWSLQARFLPSAFAFAGRKWYEFTYLTVSPDQQKMLQAYLKSNQLTLAGAPCISAWQSLAHSYQWLLIGQFATVAARNQWRANPAHPRFHCGINLNRDCLVRTFDPTANN